MKLERLDRSTVAKAVSIYLDLAYAGEPPRGPDLSVPSDADWRDVLGLFREEEVSDTQRRRYTFRLGNQHYPFMKLVLQEHMVPGEFFFGVDTHDDMEIRPDVPDYDEWMRVRRLNRRLKQTIESELTAKGIHTAEVVCAVGGGEVAEAPDDGATILVVDDEPHLAAAVGRRLNERGFQVRYAEDGEEALKSIRNDHPDLVILDYELPEMDGLEVLGRLRAEASTAGVPVLLCTAGRISVEDIARADGFLAKPVPRELLDEMVDRLLQR